MEVFWAFCNHRKTLQVPGGTVLDTNPDYFDLTFAKISLHMLYNIE